MGTLKIGWARRDITVDKLTDLPGHIVYRFSRGVYDPISCTALVVDGGDDTAIFLSVDCMSLMPFVIDEIRAKVMEKNPEIDVWKILANSTHAHTGPDQRHDTREKLNLDRLMKLGYTRERLEKERERTEIMSLRSYVDLGGLDVMSGDDYRDFLTEQASDAICEAYANRAEGGISAAYGFAVVSHSRRTVYFDDISKRPGVKLNAATALHGHAMMYGNPNDEQFSHYEAGADHTVNLLYTFDTKGNLTGAVVNIPCPSQNTEGLRGVTADYWTDIRREIHARYGDIPLIGQAAASGDLSPRIMHYRKAQDRRFRLKYEGIYDDSQPENINRELYARRDIAERVAYAFDEALAWAKKAIVYDAPVKHTVKTFELSRRMITDEEYEISKSDYEMYMNMKPEKIEGDEIEQLEQRSVGPSQALRNKALMLRYESQKQSDKHSTEVHIIRIGDIAFASNQFELYMDFMHRIQARSPFRQTFIVQLCAQPLANSGSYLCTERANEGKGYSASRFCNVVSYEGGQELVEKTLEELRKLSD